jgi:hypothetical protein
LKEEALDHAICRACFGRVFGPVVRQTAKWMNIRHPLTVALPVFTITGHVSIYCVSSHNKEEMKKILNAFDRIRMNEWMNLNITIFFNRCSMYQFLNTRAVYETAERDRICHYCHSYRREYSVVIKVGIFNL